MTRSDQPDRPRPTAAVRGPSPFCIHLRSKKLLQGGRVAHTVDDVLDRSQWCWCGRTETILGPDRSVTHPASCQTGRSCFESPFASPA